MKLNVLLAKTDALSHAYKNLILDFSRFFNKAQGAFLGEKRTYSAREGTIDEPNKRGNLIIQTTVDEKFNWFLKGTKDYIDALFSQEKTNASGTAIAELVVEGTSWGTFTSLELLRLKNIVTDSTLTQMLSLIPVRSDSEEWEDNTSDMYGSKNVKQTPLEKGVSITTVKEDYILKDPNVDLSSPNYNAVVAQRTITQELGDYTRQRFSGQWTQRQRADTLRRKHLLSVAIIEALKVCNEIEVVPSELTSDKIFGYILSE